ncbi:DNA topoisomerase I [Lentinula raphanica]|uniref:DNA topoisomerase I n=1 Tax=Lentinula raphanica TaxID=153919 RepID=A0AA38PA98_9AGAR|nr:DNA topoisomerase I [Lentinula raphanica]KAJ3829109.1 DNA topoisomerase I [Lentinula raphanica]KAJ3838978.1 DNA topoisomerase I [Lentinula raphanica]KAJ3977623.1 DNA topoisomerase I [Lentinula raphanica]
MTTNTGSLSEDDSMMGNGAGTNGHANGVSHSSLSEDEDMPLSQTVPPRRNLKRKKSSYVDSSGEDDIPLASSPAKQSTSAAISMPGAAAATTVSSSKVSKPKRSSMKKEESDDDDYLKKPAKKKPARKKVKKAESSDEDVPIAAPKPSARKRKVKQESDTESPDEDKPIVTKDLAKKAPVKKAKKEEDAERPIPKANGKAKAKEKEKDDGEEDGKGKGKKKKKKEEELEEVYRWWDADPNGDGTVKWQTLEHNGVIFPPPYEPLPSHVKMKYNGKEVSLPPESEEVAGFYAALIESDHAKDAVFNKNFFNDWKTVLKKHPPLDGTKINTFEKCDFRPMFDYFESEKAKKKALSAAEKKELKKAKDDLELKYTTCLLDGRKEKVGNFRVEPPGLFRGRGEHPKKGSLKLRVRPEDITLNIGKEAPIPIPNMPGKWKSIQHDNTVTWLATWTENINQSHKYVFLAAGSSLKGQSDMMKFEKARELKNHVDRIRANYSGDLRSKVMAERQRATAMYFIDKLALRAGNEKGEDEADTVGCCSLRCEHVTLELPNFIIFDFLGKDSIRYYNRVAVEPQIFKNVRIFKDNKEDDDSLFDRVTTASLNKHLNAEMKGLTAKVFRTYNASATFQRLLDENDLEGATLQEKLNAYNKANRLVAILCNHQRSVPKTHDQSMEKMRQKYKGLKYDRMKLRHGLFGMDEKYKEIERYQEDESDLDEDWIVEYEEQLKLKEIEKAEKKFAKENEKAAEDNIKPQPDSVLEARIRHIEEDFKRLAKERGKDAVAVKGNKTPEKLMESIDKLTERIKSFKLQMVDRDEGKEVALGTSKINYLDPRITASWCKIHDVPIERLFSKTLQVKFPWAMEVDTEWKF